MNLIQSNFNSLIPSGRQWTWMTDLAGRLCPGSGRPAPWHRFAPRVSSEWAPWKEGWGSTSCCLRETPSPCPFSPRQSWASGWDAEPLTPRRTCCPSPNQTEPVPARGRWTKSQEICPQSSPPSWSSPKGKKPWVAPCPWRPREGEANNEGQNRERDDDREKCDKWRRIVFEQSESGRTRCI